MLTRARLRPAASTVRSISGYPARRLGWPVVVLGIAVVVQVVVSLLMVRGSWMTADPLYYITERGAIPSADEGLWASHRGHWLTVPIVMYRVLFPVLGLAHGWPYLLISLTLHVLVVLVMFTLLRRTAGRTGLATLTVLPVVFLGAGSQVYVADHPMPLLLSVFLGLAALLQFVAGRPGAGTVAGALLLLLAVMSSGVGLVMMLAAGTWLLLRRGFRAALVGTLPSLGAFLVWYVTSGRNYDRSTLSGWDLLGVPPLVWKGLSGALESAAGIPGSGLVLLVLLVGAPLLVRDVSPDLRALAWAGQVGAVAQMALSAIGGGPAGYPPVTESRYVYIVLVLLAPSLAVLLQAVRLLLARLPPAAVPALIVGLAFCYLASAMLQQRQQANAFVDLTSRLRDEVVGTTSALMAGEKVLTARPDGLSERMDIKLMMKPRIARALPHGRVSAQQRLDAESEFFVGVSRNTFGLFAPEVAATDSFVEPLFPGEGCALFKSVTDHPEIAVETGTGVEVAVKSPATVLKTYLERGGNTSVTRSWTVQPGVTTHVATTARDARLVLAFDQGGQYTICKH